MKKKQAGFILAETLIISGLVLGTLIFFYVQFTNINKKYDESFRYNTVSGLYGANNMKNYLLSSGYNNLVQNLTDDYIDITSCPFNYLTENEQCNNLINALNIKQIIFTKEDITNLKKNLKSLTFDEEMKKFINVLKIDYLDNAYRIIIEYQDNTFANLKLGV